MLLSIHIILPRCCKQWLQCERSLHWWVVILLGLLLHAQLELSLHHLLPYGLSANAHVSWRRVLRTPPHLPFLGRGVPQESNDLGVWTWLSSRSALTPDLEPFLILFLRCPSFWHYLLSLVFEAPLVLPLQSNAGFGKVSALWVRDLPLTRSHVTFHHTCCTSKPVAQVS